MTRAADGARRDLEVWAAILSACDELMAEAREVDVTGFDPSEDLGRRGRWWSHQFPSVRLPDVVAFGVALAETEVAAWSDDDPIVATRAFEDRRFLFSDRLVHWVVPLTFGIEGTDSLRSLLLALGDRLRPAPILTGDEGLHLPGEDSYGPRSLELEVDLGSPQRWSHLADTHPGTARLWRDLALRAGGGSTAEKHRDCHAEGDGAEE